MNNWRLKADKIFLESDTWILATAIVVASVVRTNIAEPRGWFGYLQNLLIFGILLGPALVFVTKKAELDKRFNTRGYLSVWAVAFVLWPVLVINLFRQNISPVWPGDEMLEILIFLTLGAIAIELLLGLNQLLQKKWPRYGKLRQFSLEHAILLILSVWAIILSLMATSQLSQFYDAKPIAFNIDPVAVVQELPAFISITLQLFIAFLAGYFFYLVNHRYLIPHILKERGLLIYLISLAGTAVFCYPILGQLLLWLPLSQNVIPLIPSENFNAFDQINASVAFGIMFVSIPIILTIQWFQQNNQIITLEKQRAEAELAMLKQQINPHFFFNTLNSLYALSLKQSRQTPEVIMQLADLMRYAIYKGQNQAVSLREELAYIEDYIQLQQLRQHKDFDVRFETSIDDPEWQMPPLLLIVFVENAFKHGVEPAEGACFLHVDLTSTNKLLTFNCRNSVENADTESGGIGLENLQRRLDLLFPDRHELETSLEENVFAASLRIKK